MPALTFGSWIRARRLELELPLREVARRTRVSRTYLSMIERGETRGPPSEAYCLELARVLKLGPETVCRRAGRIPVARERQILASGAWLAVLREAQLRRVDPKTILGWVKSTPRGGDAT